MQKIKVLLVEDNPGDAELTRQALESSKLAVELVTVDDGEKALLYLRREPPYRDASPPDLVLLDLNLPKVSGEEVLREIKADRALRGLPVVVLTSSDAETEVSRCYAEGANCYVVKPVDFSSFMEIVASIEQFWFSVVKLAERKAGEPGKKSGGGR
ncbi:MAG: response regulator receiver [Elusimicrobia bacterium]|nr:MAG: response regulator receiver [Elusimicrobiota bacterium]KAF0153685.1 MAG: response regulator receiver [Elusimicrobiota bacterium]